MKNPKKKQKTKKQETKSYKNSQGGTGKSAGTGIKSRSSILCRTAHHWTCLKNLNV
jgi:hypothetical protein